MRSLFRAVTRLGIAVALLLGVIVGAFSTASAQGSDAFVRVVHASPDAPAVDIWVNGAVAIPDLAFGEATDWIPLPADSYDVAVAPAGAAPDAAVIEATLSLDAGVYYTVAAVGFLDDIGAQIYTTDVDGLAADQARVRVIHASPDAPAVDVAVADGPVLIEGLAFPDASDTLDVAAGAYDLEVLAAGTDVVALDLPGVGLAAGVVYDIFAIGSLEDGTLTVLPLTTVVSDAGTGGMGDTVTAPPSTGVGPIQASTGVMLWMLLAVAVALAVTAGGLARFPVRRRTQ